MIYIPVEIQLQWIREDLQFIKNHITNHYPLMSWPCCPDCGDESCFKFSKCINKCPDCEFAKALGLGQTTCAKHAPEFNMMIRYPL